ncbi:MAG: NPCBM/NEW2 domain-containing protein [Polyangiaceae bacterium]
MDFHRFAPSPPLGWNSWDCFATTVTESQVRAQADYMASELLRFGWQYVVVDIQWYEPGASGFAYRADAPLTLDAYGRLLPAPNRFPSSTAGAGFAPLAAYVHARGLKFGVHLMRGIPRRAVALDTPILGTSLRATEIADRGRVCAWNPDMYGVDMSKPGAQEYYDSVFALFAEWGVDYVKLDDMSRPYHDNEAEIEAVRRAIDRTRRPMVLSFSPGETALSAAEHVKRHANLWRISDDFWDNWQALVEQFGRLSRWAEHVGPGHWPDADMLPLGVLDCGKRSCRFSPDEQRTMMSLWSIARSPLMHGGDLTRTDPATLALLTNPEVLSVNQHSSDNCQLFARDGRIAWRAQVPDSDDLYVALFNAQSRLEPRDERAVYVAELEYEKGKPAPAADVDADVAGALRVLLIADDGGANAAHWVGVWDEPRVTLADGSEVALCAGEWNSATAWWGDTPKAELGKDKPYRIAGKPVTRGFGAPTQSIIEFALPSGAERLRARVGFEDSALPSEGKLRFRVLVVLPGDESEEPGIVVPLRASELGFSGAMRVRDLWEQRELGVFSEEFAPLLPWHGSGLYRVSPA